MGKLFSENAKPFYSNKPIEMSLYEFFNRSQKKGVDKYRQLWETLFQNYRLKNRSDIKGRFKSKNNEQHLSSIFELYLYSIFKYMGFKFRGHPKLKKGNPDFKLSSDFCSPFYIEATCQIQGYDRQGELLRERIQSAIRKVKSEHIKFIVSFKSPLYQVSTKDIEVFNQNFQNYVNNLIITFCDEYRLFNVGSNIIEVKPFSMPSKANSAENIILTNPGLATSVITGNRLKNKLHNKGKGYGKTRIPFALAVNIIDILGDTDEVMKGLFGEQIWTLTLRENIVVNQRITRKANGFWNLFKNPQYQRVSAVIIFFNLDFCCHPRYKPYIVMNPNDPFNQFPRNIPFFTYIDPANDSEEKLENSLYEIEKDNKWCIDWPHYI